MIITLIELRQPHHYAGQLRHAYRRADGFEIQVEGSMMYVFHRASGHGVLFPVNDVITACTEPDRLPEGVVPLEEEITEPAPKKPARKP